MKYSENIKKEFYIKVNKKKPIKQEKEIENELLIKTPFQTKTYNSNSIYFAESKNNKSDIKKFHSPINKEIKLFKSNKSIYKSKKELYSTPMSKKYKKKIIYIENAEKLNKSKNQTEFPLNNYLIKSEKNLKKIINYFNSKDLNVHSFNKQKKVNSKGKTDLRPPKNYLINYDQNSAIKLSRGKLKNNFYYPNIKNMKLYSNDRFMNKNMDFLKSTPKYSRTIINNSQSSKKKKYIKKPKYKSKEKANNDNDKKMIYIYKTKLITIFVKLMEEFFKKQIKRIFNIFLYKLKDDSYFLNLNKIYNKNKIINNNISKNKIYDYNTKINNKDIKLDNYPKYLYPNKNIPSMTMYHMGFNKIIENNNKKIYLPKNKGYEENFQNNEKYYDNNHPNPKYKIFNNMKIEKNPQKIKEYNKIYKNQNINTQINNYYNTKNTNYYFNKINSFNSLIIEKQRPRYYFPKNNIKKTSPEKINNLSQNDKKVLNANFNTPKKDGNKILLSIENKSKNLIYKKITSKDNKKKNEEGNIESLVNKTEKIFNKKNIHEHYDNIFSKDRNREYLINYYSTISHYNKDNNNNKNNNDDISNEFNNYCLEDIDKPLNMFYSKNELEEDDNNEKEEIKNIEKIITDDRKVFLNFNYIKFNQKRKVKDFIYKNKKKLKKNKLFISMDISFFILNKNEKSNYEQINNIIKTKIAYIINNKIYEYKYLFFKLIKEIKFKSLLSKIITNRKNDFLKKYFYIYKLNIKEKDNNYRKISDNTNNCEKEKIINGKDDKNKFEKKLKSFKINLLKYIFGKK